MELTQSEIGVVGRNLLGFPYNIKYPPMPEKYGTHYEGYANWNREVFFYEFAVQGYDVIFSYNGKKHYLMADSEYYCTCEDDHFMPSDKSIHFKNGNELIEQLGIDGHKLIDIIDELIDVEMV